MTRIVVDSSVVPKWFMPEVHALEAARLRDVTWELLAPDLIYSEFGNILLQKWRRGELAEAQLEETATTFLAARIETVPVQTLLRDALSLARGRHPSFYDCAYLALALREGCQCVTADRRFYAAFAAAYPETMLWVTDIPEPVDKA